MPNLPDNRTEYGIVDNVVSIINIIDKWHFINIYYDFYVYKSEKKERIIYELNINVCN